jgi:type III secretion system low calcium response chaperone LcrH/SycD
MEAVKVDDLYTQGYAFYESGKYTEAVHLFRKLTTLDPCDKDMWLGLGASLHMAKEYDKAIPAYLAAAVMSDPIEDFSPFLHAAECHLALNQIPEGLRLLEVAEKIPDGDNKQLRIKDQMLMLKLIWSGSHKK